ncbi:hypothetical protein N4R57_08980 [Rhodobacteraceae bacterium D3-12]|nr:hypothetical protein N4R57_08980 [Rhodobacteraceae bacterium D3-12]
MDIDLTGWEPTDDDFADFDLGSNSSIGDVVMANGNMNYDPGNDSRLENVLQNALDGAGNDSGTVNNMSNTLQDDDVANNASVSNSSAFSNNLTTNGGTSTAEEGIDNESGGGGLGGTGTANGAIGNATGGTAGAATAQGGHTRAMPAEPPLVEQVPQAVHRLRLALVLEVSALVSGLAVTAARRARRALAETAGLAGLAVLAALRVPVERLAHLVLVVPVVPQAMLVALARVSATQMRLVQVPASEVLALSPWVSELVRQALRLVTLVESVSARPVQLVLVVPAVPVVPVAAQVQQVLVAPEAPAAPVVHRATRAMLLAATQVASDWVRAKVLALPVQSVVPVVPVEVAAWPVQAAAWPLVATRRAVTRWGLAAAAVMAEPSMPMAAQAA